MMRKHVLQEVLDQELATWSAKSYDELKQLSEAPPVRYPVDFEHREFQVEVVKEVETADHIRVVVSVHAGGFGDFVPLAGELTIYRDGKVEHRPRLFPS